MNKSLAVQPCRIPGEIPHFKNEMGNNWSPQRQESVVFPLNNWTISTATRTTSQKHTNIYRSNFKSVKSMDKKRQGESQLMVIQTSNAKKQTKKSTHKQEQQRPTTTYIGTEKATCGKGLTMFQGRKIYVTTRRQSSRRDKIITSKTNLHQAERTRKTTQVRTSVDKGKKLRGMPETRKLGKGAVVCLTWKPGVFCFSANAAAVH